MTIAGFIFVGAWVLFVRRWRKKNPEDSLAGKVADAVLGRVEKAGGARIKKLTKEIETIRERCLDEKNAEVEAEVDNSGVS